MNFEVAEQWDEIIGQDEKKRLERMTWRGEEDGDSVQGIVKDYKTVETKRGPTQVLTITNEEFEVTVWPGKVLVGLLEKMEVEPGMKVKIVFTGMKTSVNNPDRSYRTYKLYRARE